MGSTGAARARLQARPPGTSQRRRAPARPGRRSGFRPGQQQPPRPASRTMYSQPLARVVVGGRAAGRPAPAPQHGRAGRRPASGDRSRWTPDHRLRADAERARSRPASPPAGGVHLGVRQRGGRPTPGANGVRPLGRLRQETARRCSSRGRGRSPCRSTARAGAAASPRGQERQGADPAGPGSSAAASSRTSRWSQQPVHRRRRRNRSVLKRQRRVQPAIPPRP